MCLYSRLVQNRRYIPNKKNGGIAPVCTDLRKMAVPIGCGRCMECRKKKAREWQVRLLEDVRHNKNGKFVTLTFSNESITELAKEITHKKTRIKTGEKQYVDKNGKLKSKNIYKIIDCEIQIEGYETDNAIAKLAVRKFLERWRKKHKTSARHWLVTELGHEGTENIHMHGIIWTDENMEEIEKHWKYGFVWKGKENAWGEIINYVNEKTVNYLTKYVHKQDFDHSEYKPRILTSAGIGKGYLTRLDSKNNSYRTDGTTREYYKTRTGHKIALPPYWRNKIYTDEEREKLWIEKLDKEIMWVGKEQVSTKDGMEEYYGLLKHYRQINTQLKYQTEQIDWDRLKYEESRRKYNIGKRIGKEPISQESGLACFATHEEVYSGGTALERYRDSTTDKWD